MDDRLLGNRSKAATWTAAGPSTPNTACFAGIQPCAASQTYIYKSICFKIPEFEGSKPGSKDKGHRTNPIAHQAIVTVLR